MNNRKTHYRSGSIDVSDLDSGFYIVQFDVNGKITSKKLVIE